MSKDKKSGDSDRASASERVSPEELKASSEDLTKKILGSIKKPYTGEQTARWILNLDDKAAIQNAVAKIASTGSHELTLNPVALVDKMFDDFQRYIYEFDQAHGGTEAPVHCERPTSQESSGRFGGAPVLCQGHLSTTSWALVIFALHESVKAYVIPVNHLVGFRDNEDEFSCYFKMTGQNDRGSFIWAVEGQTINSEMLSVITKRMFGHLIKVVRGEAKYNDKFTLDPEKQKPQPVEPPARRPEPGQAELLTPERAFEFARPSMPGRAPASSGAAGNSEIASEFAQSSQSVVEAFELLIEQLDHEMDVVSQIGMKAIQAQDLVGAQTTITRASTLKNLKQKVNELAREWKQGIS